MAGFTAGLFGARLGLSTIVFEELMPGGQVINAERIENFPGFPQGISGIELCSLVQEQAMNAGCTLDMTPVTGLTPSAGRTILAVGEKTVRAKAVVIAAGSSLRRLGIAGEETYEGRGVSHCGSCDGPLFMDKVVVVVGGGDSAADEAITLRQFASKVIVLHRGASLRAQRALTDRVALDDKIDVRLDSTVLEVLGTDDGVTGVKVHKAGGSTDVEAAGVFIFVGLEPKTAFLRGVVELDSTGHIVTDALLRTSVPGIFAAGDIRQHSSAQLVTSAGDGATAAINAAAHVRGLAR